jgi:hypothetical protein
MAGVDPRGRLKPLPGRDVRRVGLRPSPAPQYSRYQAPPSHPETRASPHSHLSLYDTAFYTILGVPLQLTVALLLALALNAGLRRFLGDQGSLGLPLLPSGRRDPLDIKIRHGFVSLRS